MYKQKIQQGVKFLDSKVGGWLDQISLSALETAKAEADLICSFVLNKDVGK